MTDGEKLEQFLEKDVLRSFTFHEVTREQGATSQRIRDAAWTLVKVILTECTNTRERACALTKLEEVTFWASASVERPEQDAAARAEAARLRSLER